MKYVPLHNRRGEVVLEAIVDDSDYESVVQYSWSRMSKGYAIAWVAGRLMLMHRLILGVADGVQVDHANGIKTDNRRENLREATPSCNLANRRKPNRSSTSKYKGVSWYRKGSNWLASVGLNGKRVNLGYYQNEVEAALAYDAAARYYFGVFANTNFVGSDARSAPDLRRSARSFNRSRK